ncbi:HU family DNA-binding protein [Tabrizicola flagellatus]|uniref:HU family DNA-binding protein n=1 Tax=Tabrizicola flagellatus TaxID=2593021 RepID=UPI0011F31EDD|nr:HU family DNA-binding protein [Tabrizicola flagellatus]
MAARSKDTEKKSASPAKAVAKGRKSAAKAKPGPEASEKPALRVVEAEAEAPPATVGTVKLKDLVDQVAEATGARRADIKPTVEALLAAMGAALATGKALAAPPLGKLRVVKSKGPALTLKLRLADGPKAAGLALADDGEDG